MLIKCFEQALSKRPAIFVCKYQIDSSLELTVILVALREGKFKYPFHFRCFVACHSFMLKYTM